MVEATPTNPFGEETVDQHKLCDDKIREAYQTVAALSGSREKACILTKLDEARHWLEDDRLAKYYVAGGH